MQPRFLNKKTKTMDQDAKQQIIDRLRDANNVLVTVSANPSVDQLAACIGLTLLLNKLGKHGTAVFSGTIPSTIEFLKPEETIEKNTDSLRDFIIALDKSKADKLRYKVEDNVVKIFITPYRTSLSQKDLDFSQGDFNVDVVMGLGVHERTDLDKAIMAHGRILHDATVISVNNRDQGNVGSINWVDLNASSLSEMLVSLSKGLTGDPLDSQMATAFMTGIVAETARFSNDKTSPATMTLASELMSAGANQQLIASKLEGTKPAPKADSKPAADPKAKKPSDVAVDDDGSLHISHGDGSEPSTPVVTLPPVVDDEDAEEAEESQAPQEPTSAADESTEPAPPEEVQPTTDRPADDTPASESVEPIKSSEEPPLPQISKLHDDESPLPTPLPTASTPPAPAADSSTMVLQPPTLGGKLTANSEPEHLQLDPSTDPLGGSNAGTSTGSQPLLNRSPLNDASPTAPSSPVTTTSVLQPPLQPADEAKDVDGQNTPTLTKIEQAVHSPHVGDQAQSGSTNDGVPDSPQDTKENLDEARDAVQDAIDMAPSDQPLEPIAALGAQPVNLDLHNEAPTVDAQAATDTPLPVLEPLAPANPEPPLPYFPPPSEPAASDTPSPAPIDQSLPSFTPPVPADAPATVPSSSPPSMIPNSIPLSSYGPPTNGGVDPNVPPQLMPTTPVTDTTAAAGSPAPPPPVPPPMIPPPATP